MKLLKVLGQVGAAAAAVAGLVLAGKTGFGENLFSGKDTDEMPVDDLTQPEETETTEVTTETTADDEEETSE